MQIQIDISAAQNRLREVREKAPELARKATVDAAGVMFAGSRGLLSQLVYNVAIPQVMRRKRQGGRLGAARMVALWKRTSQLLRGEKLTLSNSGADVIASIDNATPYAAARHAQTKRPAPWRDQAVAQFGPRSRDAFQAAWEAINR